MKRYNDCIQNCSDCISCSLSSYGKDCHNNPVNNLAFLRQKANMTQKELAEKSQIRQPHISRFESGERQLTNATGDVLLRLAKALDCNIEDLLGD